METSVHEQVLYAIILWLLWSRCNSSNSTTTVNSCSLIYLWTLLKFNSCIFPAFVYLLNRWFWHDGLTVLVLECEGWSLWFQIVYCWYSVSSAGLWTVKINQCHLHAEVQTRGRCENFKDSSLRIEAKLMISCHSNNISGGWSVTKASWENHIPTPPRNPVRPLPHA